MDASEYKCPNCNAELKFDPATQKLSCEYCMSAFTIDEIKEIYADAESVLESKTPEEAKERDDFEEHTNLYHCASCGADIMADDKETATFCYYCHNPVILAGKLTGEYKPSKVIGFHITREQAEDAFKKWVAKRMFVPKDFKSEQQLEKMTGLYVPFWVADCDVQSELHGIGKQVRSWTTGNYHYTETKEFKIDRCAKVTTIGIPADGESKIEDQLMEAIEPFDYKALQPFSMSYLSGFYADKFDIDKAGVFPRIKERATKASHDVIHKSIGKYSSVSVQSENYNVQRTKWEYMMLPVWFMTFKYNDKIYEFALNGQTGKLAGTPPLDKGKLKLFSAAIGLAVTLIGGLIVGGL